MKDLKSNRQAADSLAYFYCSRDTVEPERSDSEEILRCIARQLCGDDVSKPLSERLLHLYEEMDRPKPNGRKPPVDLIVELILDTLKDRPATIIIDALDECDVGLRHQLSEILDRIILESPETVKIFLTSRDNADIVAWLTNTTNIYVGAEQNQPDIERFIRTEVEQAIRSRRVLNGAISSELKDKIISILSKGAHGE